MATKIDRKRSLFGAAGVESVGGPALNKDIVKWQIDKNSADLPPSFLITIVDKRGYDNYSYHMAELIKTEIFGKWLHGLKDRNAMARIMVRLNRLADGNPGDVKPVGGGISELRVNYGPGYRVYFMQRGNVVIVLLCGGDKSTQAKDIKEAKKLSQKWKD